MIWSGSPTPADSNKRGLIMGEALKAPGGGKAAGLPGRRLEDSADLAGT